jgi:hypothetical protein
MIKTVDTELATITAKGQVTKAGLEEWASTEDEQAFADL